MNIKPKEIFVNLPIVLTFQEYDKVFEFAANINTIIHGKVKVKCEHLGVLGDKQVGLFYLQRNGEYQDLRDSFMELIEAEEMNNIPQSYPHKDPKTLEEYADNDLFRHLEHAVDLIPTETEKVCGWCHDPACRDES